MARCDDCIHAKVCDSLIPHGLPWNDGEYPAEKCCYLFKPTADVAPRAEWISVEERLPDQYEDVLGFCHYVYESGGVFDLILTMKLTTDGKFVPFNCSPLKEGIVTHWMPLPEPPKGG